jgi:hypothetical protein
MIHLLRWYRAIECPPGGYEPGIAGKVYAIPATERQLKAEADV